LALSGAAKTGMSIFLLAESRISARAATPASIYVP
jgi:hypothetical protein